MKPIMELIQLREQIDDLKAENVRLRNAIRALLASESNTPGGAIARLQAVEALENK